jgi:hypothetical protein
MHHTSSCSEDYHREHSSFGAIAGLPRVHMELRKTLIREKDPIARDMYGHVGSTLPIYTGDGPADTDDGTSA